MSPSSLSSAKATWIGGRGDNGGNGTAADIVGY